MIIEITENIVATHVNLATNFMKTCRDLGIKFALDDFGVGLSSFTHLKHLPVDYLKIDGSFIKNIKNNTIDKQLVRSMIDVSHTLNIKTIAEFVEDKETMQLLSQLGTDYTQGYYHGKPRMIDSTSFKTVKKHIN